MAKKQQSKEVKSKEVMKKTQKNVQIKEQFNLDKISSLILTGDLRQLSPEEKVQYYGKLCKSLGLNPLTKPFDYIVLQGREVLYANKNCAEQLRLLHGISVVDSTQEIINNMCIVKVKVQDKNGRYDIGTGVVPLGNLSGDALANALMKAETKAKRRATLSLCGLGMLDETELETINIQHAEPEIKKLVDNRAEAIEKLKKLPDEIKTRMRQKGMKLDDAIKLCEVAKWNVELITKALEDDNETGN
jgi:hypothetical protein